MIVVDILEPEVEDLEERTQEEEIPIDPVPLDAAVAEDDPLSPPFGVDP